MNFFHKLFEAPSYMDHTLATRIDLLVTQLIVKVNQVPRITLLRQKVLQHLELDY